LLALALAWALFFWTATRAIRRVNEAGLRCDLDALERLARHGSLLVRAEAMFVFVHHGGFERASARALLCTCGACAKDQLDEELDGIRRRVALAWSGAARPVPSKALVRGLRGGALTRPMNVMIIEWRLATERIIRALSAGAGDREPSPSPDLPLQAIEARWPSLRWPSRLAIAIEAVARGQPEVARRQLVGMPSWPDGSRLEQARRETLALLACSSPEIPPA